jgi:ubiquinone/menaquinone biosynthesis C-methylase UbiE
VYSFQWREVKTRVSRVLRARNSLPLGDRRVFDVGCGDGRWLRALSEFGAAPQCLAGIDLLPERINAARELCSPLTNLYNGDATKLPFVDESFDLLLSFSLFSSILARVTKISLATQMMRVLRPGGFILWHDFCVNNPRNHDVGGIRRREVAELFRGARVELERITLAPPLARSVARSHGLLKTFSNFRFLCTHYFGTIEKR